MRAKGREFSVLSGISQQFGEKPITMALSVWVAIIGEAPNPSQYPNQSVRRRFNSCECYFLLETGQQNHIKMG